MKVLIIEDNKAIAENIQKYLVLEDIESKVAHHGIFGLEIAKKQDFDVIILDLMLPGIDGIQICKQLKQIKDIPIIMATAKGELEDKLEGFEVGADDYLVKPFDLEELVARLRALTQRVQKNNIFTIWNLNIDLEAKVIHRKDKKILLPIKEFTLLELLLVNKGIAISRTEIIEEIRGEDTIFKNDGKLDVYISNLRKKLGKNFITTVKGFWYKIER